MNADIKAATLLNLKKTKSLLEKMIEMTEQEVTCVSIMQQNLAAVGLLKAAHQKLFENHLRTCFVDTLENGTKKEREESIAQVLQLTRLLNK